MTKFRKNRSQRRDPRNPTTIDELVGQKIRYRRIELGLTILQLSEAIEVSYQQQSNYERGLNRVSAGTLLRFTEVLDTSFDYFYDCRKPEISERTQKLAEFGDNMRDLTARELGKIADVNMEIIRAAVKDEKVAIHLAQKLCPT